MTDGWERRAGGHMKWEERLAQAEKTGRFTPEDREAAGQWQCCAVGEVCAKRGVAIYLGDASLYDLGIAFDDAVVHDEVSRARELYLRIVQAVP